MIFERLVFLWICDIKRNNYYNWCVFDFCDWLKDRCNDYLLVVVFFGINWCVIIRINYRNIVSLIDCLFKRIV